MKRCRSRSQYGNCWLPSGHDSEHAVPIGPDFWFAYPRPRTDGLLGYARFCGGALRLVPHYCDEDCTAASETATATVSVTVTTPESTTEVDR